MLLFVHAVEVVGSSVIRLGPLRLSAYGLCAAVGLVGALWLSLRTARSVGLQAVDLWDAGFFALGAAFVVSRTLLVIRNWDAFRRYPMLVLALPSLSYWAMGITAVAVGVYLRRKKMPLLAVMDAWAPCAALLAGFLEVGHWMEGSDAGMPWRKGGGLLPAQELGVLLSVALMVGLLWELGKRTSGAKAPILPTAMRPEAEASGYESVPNRDSRWKDRSGFVGGLGLVLGGVAAFLVAMVTQPAVAVGGEWLETGQWIAIGAMIVGVVLVNAAKEST
jgi:phosphatidylglycerol:prolipoprotein diacylglycerol transferase